MKRTFTIIFFFLVLFFLATIVIFPQWSNDPNVNLYVGTGIKPEVCSDSAGGCFVVYEHGPSKQISVRWFDKYGYQPWGWKKIIQGEYPEQWQSKSIDDGKGGIIVSYEDMLDNIPYEYKTRIRVQRINKAGTFLWGQTGIRVSLEEINQDVQRIVSDGSGGVVTVWLNPQAEYTVNRINSQGQRMWGDSGVVVGINGYYDKPIIAKTTTNYYVVSAERDTYKYLNENGQIFYTGSVTWLSDFISDQDGGIIVANRGGQWPANWQIRAQRKDSLGISLWQEPYVIVAESCYVNTHNIMMNNNGLYFFSWSGMKNGVDHIAQFQAFRNNGSNLFPQGSISISEYLQFGIAGLLPSDNFKTITVWSPSSNLTLAQVYDTLGNKIWNEDGVVLAYPALGYKSFTTDGNGGFIIGGTKNEFTIIVQQVSKYGNLGEVIIPVELTSFYANVTKNKVKLFWQTATETNNQGFEINRFTQNGNNAWERIGFVEGFGTTTEPKLYSFIDDNLNNGNYKYRLKQIDFDGTFEYSNEIEVEVNLNPKVFALNQNYPNPFNSSTIIKYELPENEFVKLKVYDILGNELVTLVNEEKEAGYYSIKFNANDFSSGIYFYRLNAGNFSATKKLLLLK